MKLVKDFDAFLKNRVNLSDVRIEQLDKRVAAVSNFLSQGEDAVSRNFIELVPQGSYSQRTIINPVGKNDEFDADVLLDMKEVNGWKAEDYVQELYTVFRSSPTYQNMVSRQTRCVTINYANQFHVDVVPFLTRHDTRYITNRRTNEFELTNPEGFNEWLEDQNRLTGGRLVKVIRLLKYLRDFKSNFSVKSVILTILLGGRVDNSVLWADPGHYKDLPTALKNLVSDLDEYLQANMTMPSISDPSCPTETFNHRWNQDEYANFRKWIHFYMDWINDAFDESDQDQSRKKWQKIFGEDFGTYSIGSVVKSSQAHLSRSDVKDTEEDITERWGIQISLDHRYRVKIGARVRKQAGFRDYELASYGNVVGIRRTIDFRIAQNNVPPPFDVYWKVRNTGKEAFDANAIRGQVVKDGGSRSKAEPTAYKGRHYVEVYIVKGGRCVALDHHPVIIK